MAGRGVVVLSSPNSDSDHFKEESETKSGFGFSVTNGTVEPSSGNSKSNSRDKTASPSCFPMSRMRKIIRSEGNLRANQDAVFLINQAAEKFLQQFAGDAYSCAKDERKKSLHYKHLSSVVYNKKRYEFLSDFVPEKLRAEDALSEKKLAGT